MAATAKTKKAWAAKPPLPEIEQSYFQDPAIDRVLGMVFTLAAEVQVLRDRLQSIEYLLDAKGTIRRADIDGFAPTGRQSDELARDRREFVATFMANVLHQPASKSDS
ncbi:MAG: hypothetical protein EXQ96_05215 [Alphaproteobacteria bacterium]|nr:hypothetical protein [Alphaproteobacteria bacterium]